MKHNHLLFSAFLFAALLFTPNVWAATTVNTYCGFALTSGSSHPTMTWETNFFGDIIITLHDGEGSTHTEFRACGMAENEGLGAFYMQGGSQLEAKNYFYAQMDGNKYILRRMKKSDDATLEGTNIKFNNKKVLWKCDENASCEELIIFEQPYEKSYICDASLDRPSITSVAPDGTMTFGSVTDATSYVARVYHDLDLLHEQTITSGEKLTYRPYIAASTIYEVTIQAYGAGNAKSRESLPANWTTTGSADNPLPLSKYCDYIFQTENSGNNNGDSRVRLTIETRKGNNSAKDTLVFSISKYDESDAYAAPEWRSKGFQVEDNYGLRYDGKKFMDYFVIPSTPTPEQSGQPRFNGNTEIRYVPKDGATVEYGKRITFNVLTDKRNVEWKRYGGNTNAATTFFSIDYIYGTKCTISLTAPTISDIDESGHVTFSSSAGATHYALYVYDGDLLVYTQENISSGDVINYGAYKTGDYTVRIRAYDADENSSDESAGYTWHLIGDLANLPASNVCNQLIRQDAITASEVYISIETDDTDGSFYITMQPDNAAFRHDEYIVESGLKYDGSALTTYFDRELLDGTVGVKFKTIKYTPKNREDVQYGKNITFNKNNENVQLAWFDASSTSRNSPNLSFTYIYGTKCSVEDAFEHTNSVTLYANHPDDNLTVNEAMTINGNNHTIGDITVQTAGALTVGSALTANKLLVEAKPGASGQVIDADKLTVSEAWTSQQLLPDEAELKPATDWYCFTVPFEVSLTDGVYTNAGVKLNSGSDYLIYRYDGEQRAATGRGWVKATENLSAGVAYLIGFKNSETAKTFRFKKATSGTLAEPNSITMVAHSSSNASDADWNAVGNPSLRHINITPNTKVQVLNNASQTFAPYQTGEKSFVVGSPFFAQGTSTLTLGAASYSLLAPALAPAQRMEACVEIYKEGRAWLDDRLYVAADEAATAEWQQGRDLPTLNTTSDRVALMHTAHYGMKLAAVELPWAEQVDYNLVLTAPTNGTYNLHTASVTDGTMVLLTKDGRPVWDLTVGDYALPLTEGTDTSYGLRLIQMAPQVPTDVMNTAAENRHRKVLNRGQLYILRDGRWYNAVGQSIY